MFLLPQRLVYSTMRVGPQPLNEKVRSQFRRQRTRDTAPERALRSALHTRGLRYRVDFAPIRGRRRADIVFTRARVAVFVDGCFWHGCSLHRSIPAHNYRWWRDKIAANVRRDTHTVAALQSVGWAVMRIWEHDDMVEAAERVEAIVRERRRTQ